jgi:hypothetical protein
MNLPQLGPWCIVERLTACVQPESTDAPIRPSRWLALGATAEWVEAKWQRWEGGEVEAKRLAALYGGIATPRAYGNPAWHGHRESPHKQRNHQHDRTGEEHAA